MSATREQIAEWMDRASSGDDEAFGQLALAVQDDLYRFGLAFALSPTDAAEMTQEALLRLYRNRRRWQPGTDALAWCYAIALNVIREFIRKRRRRATLALNLDTLACSAQVSQDSNDQGKAVTHLSEALAGLPPRQAEAITCRFLRQMSVADTAATMGCAEGTVKAAVFAGLKNLRKTMAKKR